MLTLIKLLKKIKSNNQNDLFTNLWIGLRILMVLPLTVASAECSFGKMKIVKTALALLSIENEEAKNIYFKETLKSFANSKARKISQVFNKL